MSIEKQFTAIVGKDALHRWIDMLPDEAEALVLTYHDGSYRWHHFGEPTVERSYWMAQNFANFLMNSAAESDDDAR